MKSFDVIIVGAGPSGLTCAGELSKKYNVLLLEAYKIGETSKTWCTWRDVLAQNGLSSCAAGKTTSFYLEHKDEKHSAKSSLVGVNEKKLLLTLAKRINKHNAVIKEGCKVNDMSYEADNVIVHSSKGDFTAPCIIDCSGVYSKINEKFHLNSNQVYERCLARNFKGAGRHSKEILLWKLLEGKHSRGWIWETPLSNKRMVLGSFDLSKDRGKLSELRALLDEEEKKLKHRGRVRHAAGSIPLRLNKKLALNRVLFAGDAGGGSSFGFGLHMALATGKLVAQYFKKAHRARDFSARFLKSYEKAYRNLVGVQYHLNQLIIDFVLSGDKKIIAKLFTAFTKMSDTEKEAFFRSRLKARDFKKYLAYIKSEISFFDILRFVLKSGPFHVLGQVLALLEVERHAKKSV